MTPSGSKIADQPKDESEDDDDDDEEFAITSFLGDGVVSNNVITLGNTTGLETATVKRNGAISECVGKEPNIAGPSGVGVEVYRQMVVKGGRYKKHRRRWTHWNSPGPKGSKYPEIGPMPLDMTPHESLTPFHGVRLPVVTLESVPNARRDVNLVSTISTGPSVDDTVGTVDITPVISKDSTLETDNTATLPQTKLVAHTPGVVIVTDESESEPEQPSHRRGTYHIQKKRSSLAKHKAQQRDMDVIDSAPESSAVTPSTPVVIRPKPGPAVFDPIYTIYG